MKLIFKFTIILYFLFTFVAESKNINSQKTLSCDWDNRDIVPCIIITKSVPNTSQISSKGVKRYIISAKTIRESGALDIADAIEMVPGINLTQSGPMGQQTSVFTRGTGSNHTLVLLNGIPINDQSTTQGLHDFGVDFIQSIQQIEVYTGSNGVHFGPNAIGGAINFVTSGDFANAISVSGFNNKNKIVNTNYSFITGNGWNLNFKGALINSATDSAIQGGSEKDGVKNFNGNLNAEKWINDNVKFRATVFSRQTTSEYDSSSTVEKEYTGNNLMYATQVGFDHYRKNLQDSLTLHYHKYDREYREAGVVDEYESNAYTLRGERKNQLSDKLSYGFGGEYKYDWGKFENRGSYSASTKGNIYDTGFFANVGFKPLENTTLSIYARTDDHKTSGQHNTYKTNIIQNLGKFKIGATHSTGLRNPSLYELFGTDSTGYSGNLNLNPEKSKTNELFGEFKFNENLQFSLTAYKSAIFDHVEYVNNQYANNATQTDLNQSGVETTINLKDENQNIILYGTSLSSKKKDGSAQTRRPEKTYGLSYTRKLNNEIIGPIKLNMQYQHYGQHWDTHSTNWSTILMDSTDIVDLSLIKKIGSYDFSININNLFDEVYQRPHGYMQERRQMRIGFKKKL